MMEGDIKHKHKGDKTKLRKHDEIQQIDEELRPLSFVNPKIQSLKGLKGVFILESQLISNVFSWNSQNVFEIYAADENGKRLDSKSKPILYGIGMSHSSCTNCQLQSISEVAILTQIGEKGSDDPYIYIQKQDKCCGFSQQNVYLNKNGNQTQIASINRNMWNDYEVSSTYVNQLSLSRSIFQCYCTQKKYDVKDSDGNTGIFIQQKHFCSWSNPNEYNLGFPAKYNDDQKTILLAICVYKAFSNFKKRSSKS
ncbi:hypothetical protein ABPG72_015556 [Tetrahymena utriculariae]